MVRGLGKTGPLPPMHSNSIYCAGTYCPGRAREGCVQVLQPTGSGFQNTTSSCSAVSEGNVLVLAAQRRALSVASDVSAVLSPCEGRSTPAH